MIARIDSPHLRVLIVEDNYAAAQALCAMVEAIGFDCLVTHTAGQALMTAEPYMPDVGLIDIELPGMSGFDLCQELRAMPPLNRTIFIALTGSPLDSYRHYASAAGFHHFMVKPVYYETLSAKLHDIAAILSAVDSSPK